MAASGISKPGAAVTVSLEDLQKGVVPFSVLEDAFGPSSLGIIVVKDLPEKFPALRHKLLSYSSYLANLPEEELAKLESPASKWLVGWSCGKETLKNGRYDTLKGSFYVNCAPAFEDPALQKDLSERYPSFPEYTAPNIWPSEVLLPGFETAFRELCNLIIDTAVLVAQACDRYAHANIEGYQPGYLEHVVKTSVSTKARLLHYFPPPPPNVNGSSDSRDTQDNDKDDWCAIHLDHGCLTGLTSAMFVDEAAHPPVLNIPTTSPTSPTSPTSQTSATAPPPPPPLPELPASPDAKAGLYIHSRAGAVTKISIPRNCLAFQTGEALEVITRGKFRAVPHFVRGAGAAGGVGAEGEGEGEARGRRRVARNTLAVFTQPNLWEVVDAEAGRDFAAFARGVVDRNH